MLPLRIRRSAGLTIITLSMLLALVVAAPVAAKNPPGNNGTVKIDTFEWDSHPNNEPHVDCEFEVDFYGFDNHSEYMAEVTFEAHPPTGHGLLLHEDDIFIGHDDAGGGTDLDASRWYNLATALASFSPHPQQGYHVKLTVNADGSQGADTKHKVFWVQPCDPVQTVTPPPPPPGNPPPPPGNPPPPPGNPPPPPGNPSGSGTLGSSSGPTVVMLPDTAMSSSSTSLTLLAGMALLGGSATLAVVEVRRSRSRRR